MTEFAGALIVAAVAGLIQRTRTSDDARWRYIRGWMLVEAVLVGVVGGPVVVSRGLSTSSLAVTGAGMVLLGTAIWLLYDTERSDPPVDDEGWRWVAVRASTPLAWRRRLCIVWWLLGLGYLLVALQYGGALVREPVLAKISTIVALGQFESLRAYAPVKAGQCTDARDLDSHNEVGDCSLPHRSEVAKEIDEDEECPAAGAYAGTGLDLKVVQAGPFDGSLFCVLQSTSPLLQWVGQLLPRQIAGTT